MKHEQIFVEYPNGLPRSTAQEKGEKVLYRWKEGKKVPYISHYRKDKVKSFRTILGFKLKPFRPKTPSIYPIKLEIYTYFDIKAPKKLWGKYKTTKPDCDNYVKEIKDVMTELGFWKDDAQVVDLHVVKYFAEKGSIVIRWEEIDDGKVNRE